MPWHNLRGNAASYRPRRILFLDTETRGFQDPLNPLRTFQVLRLGAATWGRYKEGKLTGRNTAAFYSPSQFWQLFRRIMTGRDTVWVVAHNAIFDLRAVRFDKQFETSALVVDAPRTPRRKVEGKPADEANRVLAVIEKSPFILGFKDTATQTRGVFVDSFNYFKSSIATLGKSCGLPKLPMPDESAPDTVWLEYCQRDVDILEAVFCQMLQWMDTHNCGMFRYSAAGQSMAAFRHRFMAHKIVIHDNANVKALERQSYYGGRAAVFRLGRHTGPFYHLDVSSLYPSVMARKYFPRRLSRWDMRDSFLNLPPNIECWRSVAEVLIKSRVEVFPVRVKDRPYYVVGNFKTTLAGPELEYARQLGVITHWRKWAEYDTAPLFADYVKYFWDLRLQYRSAGMPLWETFTKNMLNTLYGKFGQKSTRWHNCDYSGPVEPFTVWRDSNDIANTSLRYRAVGWQVQREGEREEVEGTFPVISAFVTAYGRQRMRRLISYAGKENVYYMATDSLIVNQDGYNRLNDKREIADNVLGKLRVCKVADNLDIRGLGDYTLDELAVVTGRRASAVVYADGSFLQAQFEGPAGLFNQRKGPGLAVTMVTKRPRQPCVNGMVDINGIVTPYDVSGGSPLDDSTASCSSIMAAAAESTASANP